MIGSEFSEKDKEAKTSQPVWKQEVRDEKGRKRFHGAFTGGFSAGHFNTVGSEEGWTPSQFRSSRRNSQNQQQQQQQSIESFMDDEDKREMLAERLTTRQEFSGFRTTADELKEKQQKQQTSLQETERNKLIELITPVNYSIGVLLLRKMGWREGRQIGEHENDDKKKKKTKVVNVVDIVQKNDLFGIGYNPALEIPEYTEVNEMRQQIIGGNNNGGGNRMAVQTKTKGVKGISRFGLGVLEDADENEDVFSTDDLSMYDRQLGDELPINTAAKPPKQQQQQQQQIASISTTEKQRKPAKTEGGLIINGFICSNAKTKRPKWFSPPVLPNGITTVFHKFDKPIEIPKEIQTNLTPMMRSALLGERILPSTTSGSVFRQIDQESRQRIANITGKPIPGPFLIPTIPKPTATNSSISTQTTTTQAQIKPIKLPESVLSSPIQIIYPRDLEKQKRYEKFLQEQRDGTIAAPVSQQQSMEISEFINTALMFRPVEGALGERFSKSATNSDANLTQQQESERTQGLSQAKQIKSSQQQIKEKPKFSRCDRTEQEWTPMSLLCKRFNVPNPRQSAETTTTTTTTIVDKKNSDEQFPIEMLLNPTQAEKLRNSIQTTTTTTNLEQGNENQEEITAKNDDDDERPSIDLFKAIFESDEPTEQIKKEEKEREREEPISSEKTKAKRERSSSKSESEEKERKKPHHHHHHHHHKE